MSEHPTIGDLRYDDETQCEDCGGDVVGSFDVSVVSDDGVETAGTWSGCYTCLTFQVLNGEGDDNP